MVLRRRARQIVQLALILAVILLLAVMVHYWNAFTHQEIDGFVRGGKRFVPHGKSLAGRAGQEDEPKLSTGPLSEAFAKADENKDGFLSKEEIERWITEKTQEHLNEGEGDIDKVFGEVDKDSNGLATWDEWSKWVLLHPSSLTDKQGKTKELSDLREEWDVADSSHDAMLGPHEFLCFRHPELCRETLEQLTRDVIKNLDKNGDGKLTEGEYTAPPPGQVEEGFQDYEVRFKEQRKHEFEAADTNKDGLVIMEELRVFLNPRNHIHAKTEAQELVDAADENEDGRLSLDEVMRHKDLFEQSKIMDVGETFHNDF